jgi:hypothetical protein
LMKEEECILARLPFASFWKMTNKSRAFGDAGSTRVRSVVL